MVQVTIDARQVQKITRVLGNIKNGVARVLAPSINRALNKGRTEIRREIRKVYVIKQKDIPIRVIGANASRLNGQIIIRQGMMDLNKFRVNPQFPQHRRYITAQVRVGGGKIIRTAFMTNLRYPGPYVRRTAARFPIKKLITIGAPIMASQPQVGPVANKAMGDTLAKELDRNFQRIMANAGGHA
jgi:hypothetical protein